MHFYNNADLTYPWKGNNDIHVESMHTKKLTIRETHVRIWKDIISGILNEKVDLLIIWCLIHVINFFFIRFFYFLVLGIHFTPMFGPRGLWSRFWKIIYYFTSAVVCYSFFIGGYLFANVSYRVICLIISQYLGLGLPH